jgi:hypothetical protein
MRRLTRKNAVKAFPQGLKPFECLGILSELKLRPPDKESSPASYWVRGKGSMPAQAGAGNGFDLEDWRIAREFMIEN